MADNEDVEVVVVSPEEREMMGLPPEGAPPPAIKVEVEGEADKPPVQAKAPPPAKPAAKDPPPADDAEAAFEALKRQRDESDAARQQAEQRAAGLESQVSSARADKMAADHQTVLSAIDKVKADADKAEAAYASAMENGDFAAAARQQRIMAQAETRLDKLDDLKGTIERARQAPQQQPRQQAEGRQQAPVPSDPVEARLAQGGYSPASATWLRAHPECLTDPATHNKLLAAHYDAVGSGIKPDTPDYFAALEAKVLGSATGRVADAGDQEQRAAPRQKMVAAPPSRSAPSSTSTVRNGQTVVKLTKAEADYCRETGEDINEYAANKLALIKEGKLSA